MTGTAKLKYNGVDFNWRHKVPGITSAIGNLTSANIGNMSFSGITIATGTSPR